MSKPSIFSRDYDKRMKARKKRRTIFFIIIVLAAIFTLTTVSFRNWLKQNAGNLNNNKDYTLDNKDSGKKDNESENQDSDKENGTDTTDEQNGTGQNNGNTVETDKLQEVKLPSGKTIQLMYEEEGSVKKMKSVTDPSDVNLVYSINPSANKAVVLDSNQDMYVVDVNGTVTNITKDKYTSTKSGNTITKVDYLAKKPNFIWHSYPVFVNDNLVVYITQIPWFKTTKYIYKVDINTLSHNRVYQIEGENMSFGVMTDKGLTVNVDSTTKYITADGKLTQ